MLYSGKLSNFFPGFECLRIWLGENVTPISVTAILSTLKKKCYFLSLGPYIIDTFEILFVGALK